MDHNSCRCCWEKHQLYCIPMQFKHTEFNEMCYQIMCICFQTTFEKYESVEDSEQKHKCSVDRTACECVCICMWMLSAQSFELWNLTVYHNKCSWFQFQSPFNKTSNLILTFISIETHLKYGEDAFATDGQCVQINSIRCISVFTFSIGIWCWS